MLNLFGYVEEVAACRYMGFKPTPNTFGALVALHLI